MVGWNTQTGRDAGEAIVNGVLDRDLDALAAAISARRDRLAHPACPSCGEALREPHVHDGVLIAPARSTTDRWSSLVKTVIDAMAPPNERRTK
jgi:hypothetical protein